MGCLISKIFREFSDAVLEYTSKGFKIDSCAFMKKSLTNGNDVATVSIDTDSEFVPNLCRNVPILKLSVKFNGNILKQDRYYFIGKEFYTDNYDEMLSMYMVASKRNNASFKNAYSSTHIDFSHLTDRCKKWVSDKIKLNKGINSKFKIVDLYFSYYKQSDRKLVAIIKSDEYPTTTAVYL